MSDITSPTQWEQGKIQQNGKFWVKLPDHVRAGAARFFDEISFR
jgi:hypothetical protein